MNVASHLCESVGRIGHTANCKQTRMSAIPAHIENLDSPGFADRVGIELSRAERYRIFVSLTMMDLGEVINRLADNYPDLPAVIGAAVRKSVRACDYVAFIDHQSLALLFPETPRQGAEIAARRVTDLVKQEIRRVTGEDYRDIVPVEIASFPDTAGAKTMRGFLEELAKRSRN
jgi:hypothetical protein